MSQPQHPKHPGDCTYLGSKGRFDLYFCSQGLPVPIVIARSSVRDQQWPVDRGSRSTVSDQIFVYAVDLARQQGLLEFE